MCFILASRHDIVCLGLSKILVITYMYYGNENEDKMLVYLSRCVMYCGLSVVDFKVGTIM